MADFCSPGTKVPNLVKMFGGKAVILLAILTGGQLDKLLMLLCALLLIICWPIRKTQPKTNGNKKQAKVKEEEPYPNEATIRQMVLREDAMSALKNFGYNKTEAKAALDAVAGQGHTTLETLINAALKQRRF